MSSVSPEVVPRRAPRLAREERRDQIVREALCLFATHGYSGTTTRTIAERVGITEAALYRYFPSKQSLYAEIIDRKMAGADMVDALRPAAAARDDVGLFRELARAILERGQLDPEFLRLLHFTALEGHELAEPFFASRVRRLREFLSDYVAGRIADGDFRPMDPVLAARAFLGMVQDHLAMRVVFGQSNVYTQPVEEVVETFVEIFLTGVRRTDPARAGEPR
jgi:AcrR family transcriptional regulator